MRKEIFENEEEAREKTDELIKNLKIHYIFDKETLDKCIQSERQIVDAMIKEGKK